MDKWVSHSLLRKAARTFLRDVFPGRVDVSAEPKTPSRVMVMSAVGAEAIFLAAFFGGIATARPAATGVRGGGRMMSEKCEEEG